MNAPIMYTPNVFKDISFDEIDKGFIWDNFGAPRSEAYYAQKNVPYTYGKGTGERTYYPHLNLEFSNVLNNIWFYSEYSKLFNLYNLELLFCNRYADQHQHLGWHADDSPSVDTNRPIVVITFGAERELWFKEILTPEEQLLRKIFDGKQEVEKITLGHGSVLIMLAGMQQTHLHRIPKHSRPCGPRVSLTFRGLTPGIESYKDKH